MVFPITIVTLFGLSTILAVVGRYYPIRALAFIVAAASFPLLYWVLHHEVLSPSPRSVTSAGHAEIDGSYHDEFRMDMGRGVYRVSAQIELPANSANAESSFDFNLNLKEHGLNQSANNVSCALKPGSNDVHIAAFRITNNRDEMTLRFQLSPQPIASRVPVKLSVDREAASN